MEEWRDIENHPGYQVSDTGKVRSFINNRHGVGKNSHELKPVYNKHGYPTVVLGRGNRYLISRLVATAHIPNPNNLPIVRHLDDNPKNNNVDNLAWGTQTDNMRDCVKHGRLVGDTRAAIESRKTPVIATPKNGGESVEYPSIKDAADDLDVWPQHIVSVLRGRISQTGGYKFKYPNEESGE